MNLATLLDIAVSVAGDRPALAAAGRRWDVAGFAARAQRRAGELSGRAARSGAGTVAYLGEAGPQFVEALYASGLAGLTFAPLNYRLRDDALGPLLAGLGPALLGHGPGMRDRARALAAGREVVSFDPDPPDLDTELPDVDPEQVAVSLYTSGTTARPKAVLLRHRHLTSYVVGSAEPGAAADGETALVAVPPYHIAGVMGVVTALYAGRRMVFLPRFSAADWLALARQERVTHAFVVPTMLARIVDELERDPHGAPGQLRHLAYGGGPCGEPLIRRALAGFGPRVGFVNAYGLTETSSTIAVLGPDDHRAALDSADPRVQARLGSVGRALPGVSLAVLDEDRRPLPAGAAGQVAVRGAQVSGEYRSRRDAGPDVYFVTGDRGYLDDEGFLFLLGRADDMIIRGGENIAPADVEAVLRQHPAVRDVAAVGIPDPEWGAVVGAVVVLATPVDDATLTGWARERLSSFKVPARFLRADQLPYSDTGKLLRRQLVELFR
ncbi:MAG: AMP-binding protein [Micromonosporaceae bacterium]|nr:AMP-binding protein [Micromonosporaceae bacterium]